MGSPADPPTRGRHITLAYLCGLTFILYIDRMCIGKAAPRIQEDLGLADWQMGWVHAAFTIAYGLFEVPTGHLADKYGSRKVLLRIVLWWSAFTALTGATTGFWVLVMVRFLFGAGEAGAMPNAARVIDYWFPPSTRGRIRGLVHTPALLGGVIAPIATAYLIESIGWRLVFVIYGALGVLWVAGFAHWFRETPADHPGVNAAERALIGPPPAHEPPTRLPVAAIVRNPNIWLLCWVLMAGAGTVYMTFSWYPTYLEKVRGVSNVESGWLSSLIMLGGAAGCLVGGWLVDVSVRRIPNPRWSYTLVGGPAFALAAIAFGASVFTDTVEMKTILMAVGCFGIHLHSGAWWGANSAIGGPHTAVTFAVINSSGALTAATAQLTFGMIPREYWAVMFLVAAVCLAGGSACWFLVDPRRTVYAD